MAGGDKTTFSFTHFILQFNSWKAFHTNMAFTETSGKKNLETYYTMLW